LSWGGTQNERNWFQIAILILPSLLLPRNMERAFSRSDPHSRRLYRQRYWHLMTDALGGGRCGRLNSADLLSINLRTDEKRIAVAILADFEIPDATMQQVAE
jgi:hypothetical protein